MSYKCKYCGREFERRHQLIGHCARCKKHPNYDELKNKKQLDDARSKISNHANKHDKTQYHCRFCDKLCVGKNSLMNHERLCKENPNRTESSFVKYNKEKDQVWNKGLNQYNNESIKKQSNSLKEKYGSGELINPFKGRKHTEESKEKTRLSALKYLENAVGEIKVRYSIKGCKYINELNNKFGWNLQHAENGGEVSMFGYFFDGYDKERNIVFEYDEPRHYIDVENNILCNRDIERQNYIIKQLNCEFYRYNEAIDKFYKVN